MTRKTPEIIEVNAQQFEELLERAASNTLRDADTQLLRQLLASYAGLFEMVGNQNTTIARLRKLMFGATSEKSEHVLGDAEDALNPASGDGSNGDTSDDATADSGTSQDEDSSRPPGHGRHGADAYSGAEQVEVQHPQHAAGDVCPDCGQGTLYEKLPGVLVRFTGQAPLHATD